MNKFRHLWPVLALSIILLGCDSSVAPDTGDMDDENSEALAKGKPGVNTIQGGLLLASDGSPITLGFDMWGYNYQGHMFNGKYCDSYRDAAWCQPYKDVNLAMKWNDAWISNVDKDNDFSLDRHYGFSSYIGSGAWLTNHQSGEYDGVDGETCKWNYFVKIVAAPADANDDGGNFVLADGTVMGPVIWGQFAIIQEVENDACAGKNGAQFINDAPTGFGFY